MISTCTCYSRKKHSFLFLVPFFFFLIRYGGGTERRDHLNFCLFELKGQGGCGLFFRDHMARKEEDFGRAIP